LKAGIGMKMTVMAWEGRTTRKMLQLPLRKLVMAGETRLQMYKTRLKKIFGTGWFLYLDPAGFCIVSLDFFLTFS
jgi:hypothetical protein